MTNKPLLILSFSLLAFTTCNRKPSYHPIKNIGDEAPTPRLKKWLKGEPIEDFEKGKIYVVEFWATWCVPCKAAMPHLSKLAKKYQREVTFLSVDVYEQKEGGVSINKVQSFVDAMGDKMDYAVATEDSSFMARDWVEATGEYSIPLTFVINKDRKVAWIGHPADLDTVLSKVVDKTWDINVALRKRNSDAQLRALDEQVSDKVNKYGGSWNNNLQKYDFGYPDSALLVIDSAVKKMPILKYQQNIAFSTLSYLLKANRLADAYPYGRQAMAANVIDKETQYSSLITAIRLTKENLPQIKITPGIYLIAAECQQKLLDIQMIYPELIDIPAKYNKIAMWYSLAGEEPMAAYARQKAIQFKKDSIRKQSSQQ